MSQRESLSSPAPSPSAPGTVVTGTPVLPPPPGWAPPPLPTSFDLPSGVTLAVPVQPPQPWEAPPPGAPASPSGRRSRRWVPLVAGIAVLGLVAVSVLLWSRGVFSPAAPPSAAPSAGAVPAAPVEASGGDIGREVELKAATGTARVTATRAVWSGAGELKPEAGMAYLVLDVDLVGVAGEVPVSAVATVAQTADQTRYPLAFGPVVSDPLPGALLHDGDRLSGSLGYQVPPGPVRVHFLGTDGKTLGTVEVPGP
ncbi:MAG: hypothetical protein VB093_13680 [Propionicimonas sp.]|nr:hypothetical protein [Propionicimonas sp.]